MGPGRPKQYDHRTIFSLSIEEQVLEEFKKIARREGKDMNRILHDHIQSYIKEHSEGNSQFRLDKWYQESDFKVTPAFLESSDKWSKYMEECDAKELARIQGQAGFLCNTAKNAAMAKLRSRINNK
jgi:hypothetical protein